MIIQRLSQGIRNQDWFVVGVEIMIVVVGIFIGLQVDDWNEERKSHGEEKKYLVSLRDDFIASQRMIDEGLEQSNNTLNALQNLILIGEGKAEKLMGPALARAIYNALYILNNLNRQNTTYDEMKSSGKLSIIDDQELRKALVGLEAIVQDLDAQEDDIRKLVQTRIDPFLQDNYKIAYLFEFDQQGDSWPDLRKIIINETNKGDFNELQMNHNFQSLVSYRYMFMIGVSRDINELKDEQMKIVSLLDHRLEKLGIKK